MMLLPLLLFSVPMTTKSPSPDELRRLGFEPLRLQALRDRMRAFVQEGQLNGLVTLIWKNGKLVSMDAVGYRELGKPEPMRFDTIFQVMSMTKPVTATAVCILAERGLLRLNDPVSRYLPEFADMKLRDGTSIAGPIRISHLLNHTSGIASDMPISDDDRSGKTLAEFVQLVSKQPLNSQPGTTERYSGPGISVAGRIVEVVSGMDFESFLQRNIFSPLKLQSTSLFLAPNARTRLAGVPALTDGKLSPTTDDPSRPGARFANPAGGLYSTAEDMAKWQQAMLTGGGPVLSRSMRDLMLKLPANRPVGAGEDHGFGMGWSIVRAPGPTTSLLPAGTFGHSGAFGTYSWSDPTNRIVGVILAQRLFGADREIDVIRSMVYASLISSLR